MKNRKGSALMMTLVMCGAIGTLAMSAIYFSSNSTLLAGSFDREREFKYAAEAAMAMGKSRLNYDPLALPDTGYEALMEGVQLQGADGQTIKGVTVNMYVGKTGSTSGQFGQFASVVAEARDARGARFVRRLELAQESFAKYAYWSNSEGANIVFGGGDNLWGPVWSNDDITIHSTGATFHNDVGTADVINNKSYGTFKKGYLEKQKPITLPNNTNLSVLPGYATSGGFNFNAPTNGDETSVRMRIEFVAVDLNGDGDSTDVDEGFLRVYTGNGGTANWVRGDWNSNKANAENCGAAYRTVPNGPRKFFPASVHGTNAFRDLLIAGGMTNAQATDTSNAGLQTIMQKATARCYPGGDPHLAAVERGVLVGGEDSTFTPNGAKGSWMQWTGNVDPRLTGARHGWDANHLFPIYRGLNPGTKGVIYVNGTVGISGVLRGRITIYSNTIVTVLDDMRYASDPSTGRCADILGIIAGRDVMVSDNAILGPPDINPGGGTQYRNVDDTKDLYLHAVIMALNKSFAVQAHSQGPTNANDCEGTDVGRGCLYLTGGIIQDTRGAVGTTGGTGYIKRYSYDRCAAANPPPYFPTTGRFVDNRYYELDPVRFNVSQLFSSLTPND